jgi:hypothetical protein
MKHLYGKKVKLCAYSKINNKCSVFTALKLSFGVRVGRAALGINLKLMLKGCMRKREVLCIKRYRIAIAVFRRKQKNGI